MEQFFATLKSLGIDPALGGIGVVLAIVLRFGRGMLKWMNSEWTYAAGILFGLLGAWIKSEGLGARGFAANALALAGIVIVGQKVIEKIAVLAPFLPTDDQWVKNPINPNPERVKTIQPDPIPDPTKGGTK